METDKMEIRMLIRQAIKETITTSFWYNPSKNNILSNYPFEELLREIYLEKMKSIKVLEEILLEDEFKENCEDEYVAQNLKIIIGYEIGLLEMYKKIYMNLFKEVEEKKMLDLILTQQENIFKLMLAL